MLSSSEQALSDIRVNLLISLGIISFISILLMKGSLLGITPNSASDTLSLDTMSALITAFAFGFVAFGGFPGVLADGFSSSSSTTGSDLDFAISFFC